MTVGATFLIVPQRCHRVKLSIKPSRYTQCVNTPRHSILPSPSLQCSIYASRHYASASKGAKRKAPQLAPPKLSSKKQQSQPTKANPPSKPTTKPALRSSPPKPPNQPSAPRPEPTRSLNERLSDNLNARISERHNERLNPPPFSYAPPLDLPERKPDQTTTRHIWAQGKAYFAFYKQGIQNVRHTAKLAKQLRQKARDTVAIPPSDKASSEGTRTSTDLSDIVLTRAEWQVVRRSRRDLVRLPVFGLVFLVFGEWTPLLVAFITPVIPEPCRILRQNRKALTKLESRRRERLDALALKAPALIHKDRRPGTKQTAASPTAMEVNADLAAKPAEVKDFSLYEALAVSSRLDAHSWVWEYFMRPPAWWLRWSVWQKLWYLRRDDGLIVRDGGVAGLGLEEVRRACVERGIFVEGKGEVALRKELEGWFKGAGKGRERKAEDAASEGKKKGDDIKG